MNQLKSFLIPRLWTEIQKQASKSFTPHCLFFYSLKKTKTDQTKKPQNQGIKKLNCMFAEQTSTTKDFKNKK